MQRPAAVVDLDDERGDVGPRAERDRPDGATDVGPLAVGQVADRGRPDPLGLLAQLVVLVIAGGAGQPLGEPPEEAAGRLGRERAGLLPVPCVTGCRSAMSSHLGDLGATLERPEVVRTRVAGRPHPRRLGSLVPVGCALGPGALLGDGRARAGAAPRAGGRASSSRTTTTLRTSSTSGSAWLSSVAAGPLMTARRNQRGPSTPRNRTGVCTGRPSAPWLGIAGGELAPQGAVDDVGRSPLRPHAVGDLGADVGPDPHRARRREHLQLHTGGAQQGVGARHGLLLLVELETQLHPLDRRDEQRPEVDPRHLVVVLDLGGVERAAGAVVALLGVGAPRQRPRQTSSQQAPSASASALDLGGGRVDRLVGRALAVPAEKSQRPTSFGLSCRRQRRSHHWLRAQSPPASSPGANPPRRTARSRPSGRPAGRSGHHAARRRSRAGRG